MATSSFLALPWNAAAAMQLGRRLAADPREALGDDPRLVEPGLARVDHGLERPRAGHRRDDVAQRGRAVGGEHRVGHRRRRRAGHEARGAARPRTPRSWPPRPTSRGRASRPRARRRPRRPARRTRATRSPGRGGCAAPRCTPGAARTGRPRPSARARPRSSPPACRGDRRGPPRPIRRQARRRPARRAAGSDRGSRRRRAAARPAPARRPAPCTPGARGTPRP